MSKILLMLCLIAYQWGPPQSAAQPQTALELYYAPWCPHSQAVLQYLASIHKTVPLKNVDDNPQAKEELKILGGKMQVPCLLINGVPLYHSEAIIQWLSDHRATLPDAQDT